MRDGGKSQKLILFKRGKDISGDKFIIGINQFPKPPIITGITKKKIIINACEVTTLLKIWSSPSKDPGVINSIRIMKLNEDPIIADHSPKIKYKVPISLWLVDIDQRYILNLYTGEI